MHCECINHIKGADCIMSVEIIEDILMEVKNDNIETGRRIILEEYPFQPAIIHKRQYSEKQKMEQFKRDGFIDRYTGEKLVNPGVLKMISFFYPKEFPYHAHWKMTDTHVAYMELIPTIDHIVPISKGGSDSRENWVTTSMNKNAKKSNWTLDEIGWKLYPAGNIDDWDGLTKLFISLVEKYPHVLKDNYIAKWYRVSL